jgi:hypothetical protein
MFTHISLVYVLEMMCDIYMILISSGRCVQVVRDLQNDLGGHPS